MDRLLPNNPEAERGILGCVLLDSGAIMPEIRHVLPEDAFYDGRHQILWRALCELFDEQKVCDSITVYSKLRTENKIDDAGGFSYLSALPDASASSLAWRDYVALAQKDMLLRRAIRFGSELVGSAYETSRDVDSFLDAMESDCLAIRRDMVKQSQGVDWKVMRKRTMDEYQEALSQNGRKGLKTGFTDLDIIMGGLREQEFILIAGSPSSGKTSLALNIIKNASKQGVKSGLLTLETSGFLIVHRLNCIVSRADGARLLNGTPLERDINLLVSATSELEKIGANLIIHDETVSNCAQAASVLRWMHSQGARLFVVDYLQLLDAPFRTSNGNERMTAVSKAMKNAAKELNCPLIAISSLNRESAKEQRAPRRSDLRESGQLEFDANVILLLHPEDYAQDGRTIHVNVDKNKDGETGKVQLVFLPSCMRFEDASRVPC